MNGLFDFFETEAMKCVRKEYGICLALNAFDEDELKEMMILSTQDLSGVDLGIGRCNTLK